MTIKQERITVPDGVLTRETGVVQTDELQADLPELIDGFEQAPLALLEHLAGEARRILEEEAIPLSGPAPGVELTARGYDADELALALSKGGRYFDPLAPHGRLDPTPPRDEGERVRSMWSWYWGVLAGMAAIRAQVRPLEPDVITGRKVRSAGRKTRRILEEEGGLAAQHRETFEALAQEVRQKYPRWGVTAIRDAVVELVQTRYTAVPCSRRTLERLKIPTM